jgi:hypothetical protein
MSFWNVYQRRAYRSGQEGNLLPGITDGAMTAESHRLSIGTALEELQEGIRLPFVKFRVQAEFRYFEVDARWEWLPWRVFRRYWRMDVFPVLFNVLDHWLPATARVIFGHDIVQH